MVGLRASESDLLDALSEVGKGQLVNLIGMALRDMARSLVEHLVLRVPWTVRPQREHLMMKATGIHSGYSSGRASPA